MEAKLADLIVKSSAIDKAYHKQWHQSNMICLMVMKFTIKKNYQIEYSWEGYCSWIFEGRWWEIQKKIDKSQKACYLSLLDNTCYDGVTSVHEHIMKLVNYYNKLKSCDVHLGEKVTWYIIFYCLSYLSMEF